MSGSTLDIPGFTEPTSLTRVLRVANLSNPSVDSFMTTQLTGSFLDMLETLSSLDSFLADMSLEEHTMIHSDVATVLLNAHTYCLDRANTTTFQTQAEVIRGTNASQYVLMTTLLSTSAVFIFVGIFFARPLALRIDRSLRLVIDAFETLPSSMLDRLAAIAQERLDELV
ncbi:MAG: hypothetical protein MHM6MM_002122 [Cercozoa sp. M6MM]